MATLQHLAVSLDDVFDWCRKNNISLSNGLNKFFSHINQLIILQVTKKMQVLTIYMLKNVEQSNEDYSAFFELMVEFFEELSKNPIVHGQKLKISIFGKWYALPGKVVESLKNIIEQTKDYDNFFVNFCINYDGQEEIVDATKVIAKHVELKKIDPGMITKSMVKENLYSSYFVTPDILLMYGLRKLTGLLLWDSMNSTVVFADKSFMEFEDEDFEKIDQNIYK